MVQNIKGNLLDTVYTVSFYLNDLLEDQPESEREGIRLFLEQAVTFLSTFQSVFHQFQGPARQAC